MRKKLLVVLSISMLIICLMSSVFAADEMTIKLTTSKSNVAIGNNVDITVNFSKSVKKAEFSLNYNSSVLEFVGTELKDEFYNSSKAGTVEVKWSDVSNVKTSMKFTFKVKAKGESNISIVPSKFETSDSSELSVAGTTNAVVKTSGDTSNMATPSTTSTPKNVSTPVAQKTQEVLPQTGTDMLAIKIIAVAVVLAIIIGIKVYKMREIK